MRGIVSLALLLAACSPPNSNPYCDFGITANNAFFYYSDLDVAVDFYTQTLGIEIAADYGFAKILHIAGSSFLTLVDADSGMHSADEPKTVALALVTDQLEGWWDYIAAADVQLLHPLNLTTDRPHDGFVAIDPEGYLLEFERFNAHEENEQLVPVLDRAQTTLSGGRVPPGLGFKATVIWTYYSDLQGAMAFYENNFGLEMIVDQGWTKIYQTSPTGFLAWSTRNVACIGRPNRKASRCHSGPTTSTVGLHTLVVTTDSNFDRIQSGATTGFTLSSGTMWRGITWSSTAFSSMRTTQNSSN